jgi:hypothetical protein
MLELQPRPYTMCRSIGAAGGHRSAWTELCDRFKGGGQIGKSREVAHPAPARWSRGHFQTDKRMKPLRKHFGSGLTERSNRHVR